MKIRISYTKINSLNTWDMSKSSILIYPTPTATYRVKFKPFIGEKYQGSRDVFFFFIAFKHSR